jgi:hypothetical protein
MAFQGVFMSATFIDLVMSVCEMDCGDEAAAARSLSRWVMAIFQSCYKPEERPTCAGTAVSTAPRYEQRVAVFGGIPRAITVSVSTTCRVRTHPQSMCATHDTEWEL